MYQGISLTVKRRISLGVQRNKSQYKKKNKSRCIVSQR